METLGIKTTFNSGVVFELKRNAQNELFVSLSGGALAPVLQNLNISEFLLPSTQTDLMKLSRLLNIGNTLSQMV